MGSTDTKERYLPGLDGIRALAVGAVVAYHLRVPFFDGGLLGVSVFFTLSGYLITSLLVRGFDDHGKVDLKSFWIRRARRLLPALYLMLPVVTVTAAIAHPEKLARTFKEVIAALLYVANWTTIARGDDYFQRFTGPGPLDHLWSLAIEEQFYIVWPLLVFGLLALGLRRKWGRIPLAIVTVLLTAASTFAIAWLYDPHAMNNTRAYEGTDTRAASLLVGALVAIAIPFDRVTEISRRGRIALDFIGLLGLAGVAACIMKTDEYSSFLYRGGELALAIATIALTVAAAHPETFIARFLGVAPLRWIGARSYGVYLWHLPVVAFVPSSLLIDKPLARGALQLGLILVLAAASFWLIEDPIRRRVPPPRPVRIAFRSLVLGPIAAAALILPVRWFPPTPLEALAAEPDPPSIVMTEMTLQPLPLIVSRGPLYTSCKEVTHVGDSTSIGLVASNILPKESDQVPARYRAVGVERFFSEISGARSMVETYGEKPNATEIVKKKRANGYKGCWVMALGTNDPANTDGNIETLSARIDGVMSKIGKDAPALWTTSKTMVTKGFYRNENMLAWNQAVTEACTRHPNMRVYDWASEYEDSWFTSDNIHPNPNGYRERALRLARALARAFPKNGDPPTECIVHGGE